MIPTLLVLWLAAATPLEQAQNAVMQGQEALAQQRYAEAARLLQEGVEPATAIDDPAVRTQALAAVHFFSALAYSQFGEASRAREELERFLVFSPTTKSVDRSQYPAPFVATFDKVAKAVRAVKQSEFDRRYPGYRLFSTEAPQYSSWEPAAEYLATPAEAAAWKEAGNQAARATFVEEFWKRRDPTPKTGDNEFRAVFDGRVAYADRMFEGPSGERGSLSDRGRVLILLGKPRQVIYERINERSDAEIWGYDREQLPVRIRDRSFLFRFVHEVARDFILPFNAEAERVLTAASAKAIER